MSQANQSDADLAVLRALALRPANVPALLLWSGGQSGGHSAFKVGPILEPVMRTLVAGIRQYPRFGSIHFLQAAVTWAAFRNLKRKLRRGDIFVWVGVAGSRNVPWQSLRQFGIFTVHYQTEPWDVGCALYRDSVDELWDFSWHNIDACVEGGSHPGIAYYERGKSVRDAPGAVRYVPLGADSSSPQVEHPTVGPPLAFLGEFESRRQPRRYHCLRAIDMQLKQVNAPSVLKRRDLWDAEEYRQLLRTHDIWLNIHKLCGDAHNPVTFRVQRVLSAGGLLISERAYWKDEREFDGLVDFVGLRGDNSTALVAEYRRVATLSATERAEIAATRQRRFHERFSPKRIFERTGLYALFDRQFNLTPPVENVLPTERPEVVSLQTRHSPLNAVLATVDFGGAFGPSAFRPFICSFLLHVLSATLVLFVRPPDALPALLNEVSSIMRAAGVNRSRVLLQPWPDLRNDTGFSQIWRYSVYSNFLAHHADGRALERVATSDAIDVAFQADPFALLADKGVDLVFNRDNQIIGSSHGNRYWVRNLYGQAELDRVAMRNVSCSGFSMGRRDGMVLYLRRMTEELDRLIAPRLTQMAKENMMLAKGYDQGVHNMLVYGELLAHGASSGPRHPLAIRLLRHDQVYISAENMKLGRAIEMDGPLVVSKRTRATIAVVHQYNRMQWLVRDVLRCTHKTVKADHCSRCADRIADRRVRKHG